MTNQRFETYKAKAITSFDELAKIAAEGKGEARVYETYCLGAASCVFEHKLPETLKLEIKEAKNIPDIVFRFFLWTTIWSGGQFLSHMQEQHLGDCSYGRERP